MDSDQKLFNNGFSLSASSGCCFQHSEELQKGGLRVANMLFSLKVYNLVSEVRVSETFGHARELERDIWAEESTPLPSGFEKKNGCRAEGLPKRGFVKRSFSKGVSGLKWGARCREGLLGGGLHPEALHER